MGVDAKVLILSSDFTGEVKKVKVKDGMIAVKDGKKDTETEFLVDKARPFLIRFNKMRKPEPTYICKWNSVLPSQFKPMETEEDGKKITTLQPLEISEYKSQLTPKILSLTSDLRFMKSMKKYSGDESSSKMPHIGSLLKLIVIFGVIGFILITVVFPMMKGG